MAQSAERPIIIKKKKAAEHGHHGGAWKVAYADFVTAMMAFFLLMWLLASASEEQKQGLAEFFSPKFGIMEQSPGSEGVFVSNSIVAMRERSEVGPDGKLQYDNDGAAEQEYDFNEQARQERQEFQVLRAEIEQKLFENERFADLLENLRFEITREGLRIEIFDREGAPMFASGDTAPSARMREILQAMADVLQPMRHGLVVTGHTDAQPFASEATYGNWELSADRANASRRVLRRDGIGRDRIRRVEGKAATTPLIEDNPSDVRNRRIAITILRPSLDPNN